MSLDASLRRVRIKASLRGKTKIFGLHGLLDVPFRNLLNDAAAAHNMRLPPLYPINAGANYSLLYCLFRTITEVKCKRVLEIGAGQTTLLLAALSRSRDLIVDTLEPDNEWAMRLQQVDGTRIHYSSLKKVTRDGITALRFENAAGLRTDYDVVLVDGPNGTPRNSRYGCMDILAERLAAEFVVIFDDAERRGEQDTIKAFLGTSKGSRVQMRFVGGTKWQCLLFTQQYSALRYY
jgi:hypothetical protein